MSNILNNTTSLQEILEALQNKVVGESNILTSSFVSENRCANGGDYVSGYDVTAWTFNAGGYTIYGFALSGVRKLKLTGAVLHNSIPSGTVRENILFVSGFTGDGGGMGVIDSVNIETEPTTYDESSPPSEYIITVPQGLGVDGIYLSCLTNKGVPILEVIEKATYNDGYEDGYEAGKAEGENSSAIGVIVSNYLLSGYSAVGQGSVGMTVSEWAPYPSGSYNTYGYALDSSCKQLKLTGTELGGGFTSGIANKNILFVTGYTSEGGGIGVVAPQDITVTPAEYEAWGNPSSYEFIIDIPSGCNIDGVYLSVSTAGTPVLECIKAANPDYENGYNDGYADGFEAGKAEGGGSGDNITGTDVTASFSLMANYANTTSLGSTSLSMAGLYSDTCSCYYGNVTSGQKYGVFCTPMNPDNLWENFLLANDDYSTLAIAANDENVGQYVTKVNEGVYKITIPNDCEMLHINFKVSDGCTILLLD